MSPAELAALPWPDRLRHSSATLVDAGLRLRAALLDERRSALLTDQTATSDEALAEVRDFERLLRTALAALIDLSGYDDPDRDYPDLTNWFRFTCPNVTYGWHTTTGRATPPR